MLPMRKLGATYFFLKRCHTVTILYCSLLADYGCSSRLSVWAIGRAQLISRRKMSNFTTVFGQQCQISRKFHGRLFVILWTPEIIYMHWYIGPKAYLRYLIATKVINVTNGHFTVHWYADRLTAYQVARAYVQLHIASANYKLLMVTV